jgi:hypothetical protein
MMKFGVMECCEKIGVLEYWSIGKRKSFLILIPNAPSLQYSIIPILLLVFVSVYI